MLAGVLFLKQVTDLTHFKQDLYDNFLGLQGQKKGRLLLCGYIYKGVNPGSQDFYGRPGCHQAASRLQLLAYWGERKER